MRLTDELREARRMIHAAMYEQELADDARCASAGRRYFGEKPSIHSPRGIQRRKNRSTM